MKGQVNWAREEGIGHWESILLGGRGPAGKHHGPGPQLSQRGAASRLMPLEKWVGRNGTACEETAKGSLLSRQGSEVGRGWGNVAKMVKGKTWAGGNGKY